jgi:hypothetical protein
MTSKYGILFTLDYPRMERDGYTEQELLLPKTMDKCGFSRASDHSQFS